MQAVDIENQIAKAHQDQQRLDQEFLDQMGANQKMDNWQNLQTTIKNEQAALQQSQKQLEQLRSVL